MKRQLKQHVAQYEIAQHIANSIVTIKNVSYHLYGCLRAVFT